MNCGHTAEEHAAMTRAKVRDRVALIDQVDIESDAWAIAQFRRELSSLAEGEASVRPLDH